MPKGSVAVSSPLRAARLAEGRGWSLRLVARKIHSNPTSLSEWERGLRTPPSDVQAALCKIYRAKPTDLGFELEQEAKDSGMVSENLSRRAFLVSALAVPILLGSRWQAEVDITGETLETLAAVNDRYRAVQVQGFKYSREQLLRHMATIEHLLDTSLHARGRRDLYQILARTQLLARAGGTSAERLTLTERALASAQLSGNTYLQAAVFGHLGQFYTFRLDQPTIGEHYLDLASQLARGDRLLTAWIAAQRAEASSRLGLRGETLLHLRTAEDETGSSQEDDRYFGEWSIGSLEAYRGTCWLYLGAYEETIHRLEDPRVTGFSNARRLTPLIDLFVAYGMTGDFANASRAAMQALDLAYGSGREVLTGRIHPIAARLTTAHPYDTSLRTLTERIRTLPTPPATIAIQ